MIGNRQISFLSAVVVFFTLLVPASAAHSQRRSQRTGVVTDDFVTDGYMTRRQISGATIRLYSLNRVLQTKSDTAGHFQFTNLPDDVYDLEIAASGFKQNRSKTSG